MSGPQTPLHAHLAGTASPSGAANTPKLPTPLVSAGGRAIRTGTRGVTCGTQSDASLIQACELYIRWPVAGSREPHTT